MLPPCQTGCAGCAFRTLVIVLAHLRYLQRAPPVLERAKILCDNGVIRVKDLPKEVIRGTVETHAQSDVLTTDDLGAIQRRKVVEVLRREAGNKSKALGPWGSTAASLSPARKIRDCSGRIARVDRLKFPGTPPKAVPKR